MEPIAIVGLGCRFPGAPNPTAFWELLARGGDAVQAIPPNRWDAAAFYDPDLAAPGKMNTRWGGFLEQIDGFDHQFFRLSRREANHVDPQQRLMLEVAWEALEDAGQTMEQLAGSQTGVFIGIGGFDYARLQWNNPAAIDAYTNTGSLLCIAANRISYIFDLRGPSLIVDTACSASLVAVHLACQSLASGESELAIAGGVNLIIAAETTLGFSKLGAMAPDGRCKAFDARGNGYVRGEGAGAVILKPLARALAAGDRIYGLVRGSAVNQDGRTNGLTAPSRWAQEAVLRRAYADAGIAPGTVRYVEAHGTGTLLGDPIEVKALGSVLAAERPPERPCLIGSVKTNIGHLEPAAGIAGLIKVALMLHHGGIPPSLHLETPNPHIPFASLPLQVARTYTPWPDGDTPPIAGVSSFSFGGTNAHVVLEGYAAHAAAPRDSGDPPSHVLPISAHSPAALADLARAYHAWLTQMPEEAPVADLCYSASARRSHHAFRVAAVGRSAGELRERVAALIDRPGPTQPASARPQVVFVFPGQGSQWIGMGRELLAHEPAFARALADCAAAVEREVPWSLHAELLADGERSRLAEVDVVQPILFALEVALARLWQSWGVEPDLVIGHSMGEVAAAHLAGALTLEDAARVICRRSRLLRRVSGQGAMAVVELSEADAAAALAGYEQRLSIAVINNPRSTVISGDPTALAELMAQLSARKIFCRHVKVDVASHSPQMDVLCPDLLAALAELQPRAGHVPIWSTALGGRTDGAAFDAHYWMRNLRDPVRFADAVQQAAAVRRTVFIELSPHPILLPAIDQGLHHAGLEGATLPSGRRDESERRVLADALAALYTLGGSARWASRFDHDTRLAPLPLYTWQRERFWLEEAPAPALPHGARLADGSRHPLLATHLASAADPAAHFWELELRDGQHPYLSDHGVQGAVVFPAAAHLELALAAAQASFGAAPLLAGASFDLPLVLGPEPRRVQVALRGEAGGLARFQVASRATSGSGAWTVHATGRIGASRPAEPPAAYDLTALRAELPAHLAGAAFYQRVQRMGYAYGPRFRGVAESWSAGLTTLARIELPATVATDAARYLLHPALLDSCLHAMLAPLLLDETTIRDGATFVPVGVERVELYHTAEPVAWSYGRLRDLADEAGRFSGDCELLDASGQVLVRVVGLQMQRLAEARPAVPQPQWQYRLAWEPLATPPLAATPPPGRWLIAGDADALCVGVYAELTAHGQECVLLAGGPPGATEPEELARSLRATLSGDGAPWRGVVLLPPLDAAELEHGDGPALLAAQVRGLYGALHLAQAMTQLGKRDMPRLWLVSRGAQQLHETPGVAGLAQTPLWGFGRTLSHEFPALQPTLVDLDSALGADAPPALVAALLAGDGEDQLLLTASGRLCARLVPAEQEASDAQARIPLTPGRDAMRLVQDAQGLAVLACPAAQPGPGEVAVHLQAALVEAGGQPALHAARIGRVGAAGPGVNGLAPGDTVAVYAAAAADTTVVVPATSAVPLPTGLGVVEAAAAVALFAEPHYALHTIGGLQPGASVLVCAGTLRAGLAAAEVARGLGARVLVAAPQTELACLSATLVTVPVFDLAAPSLTAEVQAQTGGAGADLVLLADSLLAPEHAAACLRPGGRLIALGAAAEPPPALENLFWCAARLDGATRSRPELVAATLREVLAAAAVRYRLPTLDTITFDATRRAHATPAPKGEAPLDGKAPCPHISILELGAAPLRGLLTTGMAARIGSEGTYLISGGLGDLGLACAAWLVERGARQLVLLGRRPPGVEAERALTRLRAAGASVLTATVDVAQTQPLAELLARVRATLPPLHGVIHAAGLLDDATLSRLDTERFRRVLEPKLAGAWNLHTLTLDDPLRCFVLFSSAAALLGSPGQANYAAANAFLDGLASYRRGLGRPALSVGWGPWSEIGLAARAEHGRRLASSGLDSIAPALGLQILGALLAGSQPHIAVLPLNLRRWRQSFPRSAGAPLFARLDEQEQQASQAESSLRERLRAIGSERRRLALLSEHLVEQVALTLRGDRAQIHAQTPFHSMGFDSLLSVELRNRLEVSLGLTLPGTLIWSYPNIAALAAFLDEQLAAVDQPGPQPGAAPPVAPPAPDNELDELSEAELARLLATTIERLEGVSP